MKKIFLLVLIALGLGMSASAQVGIGTNSPSISSILELKSSTKGLLFPRTSTTTRLSMVGVKGLMIYDTTVSQFFFHTGSTWRQMGLWQAINGGEDMISLVPGNVGIGGFLFSVPHKLSVYGDAFITGNVPTIRLGGTSSSTISRILWELPDNATDYGITQSDNALWISRHQGFLGFIPDLVLTNNGYLGVGTGTPETRFNVVGGTDVGNGSGGYLQLGENNGLNIGFDNNEIQARNNGVVTRLHLNNGGGTVQIGGVVAPTTYSLAVDGRVICEELKIQASSNWADYVFAEDYSLRSFDELRNFIQINNHLPNIPDADYIEKNGIEIGDMQKRMMEKIEELTLYILQLEEKSRAHEKEIQALKMKSETIPPLAGRE